MYARHKPESDWKNDDEYPDFNIIKADQSFNWSAYSTGLWAKFSDKMEFKNDYGIVAYNVKSIRNSLGKISNDDGHTTINHKPLLANYSHCELSGTLKQVTNKALKREIRANFKHNCIVICKPKSNKKNKVSTIDRIVKCYHLALSKIKFLK